MGPADARPALHVIDADASPEEVAAIVAAVGVVMASGGGTGAEPTVAPMSSWVSAARLRARRSGLSRGDWRLSGRIGRRSRA